MAFVFLTTLAKRISLKSFLFKKEAYVLHLKDPIYLYNYIYLKRCSALVMNRN